MTTQHTTEAAGPGQAHPAATWATQAGHARPMTVVKYTDADGVEHRIGACNAHVPQAIRAHLDEVPAILPAPRGTQCGEPVKAEYEFIVARSEELSGETYDVYTARVLDFTGRIGEYNTIESFEVTVALAVDPEVPSVHPRTVAFVNAVDIATRTLESKGYTRTQSVTCRGPFGDGRVAK